MRKIFWCLSFVGLCLLLSCEPEDEKISFNGDLKLSVTADTVYFDTVFTEQMTVTKKFKIYNKNKNALIIEQLKLRNALGEYELIVNGKIGSSFENLQLLGQDSMQVLVRAFIDSKDQDQPFVVDDFVDIRYNGNVLEKVIKGWGQDAYYFKDTVLPCNTTWSKDRPIVLVGNVLVETSCILNIEPGTTIFAHKNATLYIRGSLNAQGTNSDRIQFANDRKEPIYDAPGQWNGIYFLEGSSNNLVGYCTIKNANIGLRVGTPDNDNIPDVIITNSIVYNMAEAGILGFTSDLLIENSLVFSCGKYTFGGLLGGNYQIVNCTFANGLNYFIGQEPSFALSNNLIVDENTILKEPLNASCLNSIIWGNTEEELLFSATEGADFTLQLSKNILKTQQTELGDNNILNQDPKFISPFELNYKLDTLSPANGNALSGLVLLDLEDLTRELNPDIGCYERIEL